MKRIDGLLLVPLMLALAGCAADEAAGDFAERPGGEDAGIGGGAGGTGGGGGELPPEREQRVPFSQPAAGRAYVWVASPSTDSVVRIHAETLAIGTIEVGDEPTEVRTLPDQDVAVVLNRGSDELAVVAAGDEVTFHALPHHFNALTLDPTGRYAFAWFDLERARTGEDASAIQDVAVLDLESGALRSVAIGFRPREVAFADGRAYFVTEDGLSVVDPATRASIAPAIPLAPDALDQGGREVAVTPDGAYAVSRGPGEPGVAIVALAEGEPRVVPLGAQPTDLDLLPDGRTALVMLRDAERLALVPLETAVEDPDTITFVDFPGRLLGSAAVAPGGEVAVLYTTITAEGEATQVGLLDLQSTQIVYRPLRKGIAAVAVDPAGEAALVLHTKAPGEPDPAAGEDIFIARSHGYSLLDLRTTYAKLRTTPAPIVAVAFDPAARRALLAVSNPDRRVAELQRVDLDGFEVAVHPLGSPPETVGVLPAVERAFVTQTHPEGRISFLDLDDGRLETVSGYTLNGRIE